MKQLPIIILFFIILSIGSVACGASPSATEETLPSSEAIVSQIDPTPSQTNREEPTTESSQTVPPTNTPKPTEAPAIGCVDAEYPDWETSEYVLPFPVGETYSVNLSNCSSSYHSKGTPDQFAVDFAMDRGTLITAARAGVVIFVEESGKGREINNLVVVSHKDNTYAEYMHLMKDGALVEEGDLVEQGDEIGLSGATGLAGYPHLHFIVVEGPWEWPYEGIPITFSNTAPNPYGLASYTDYTALDYP